MQTRYRQTPNSSLVRLKDKDDRCCGVIFLKTLLYIFNFLLFLSGLAIAAVGLWTILAKYSFVSLLASICYQATAYLLIVCGAVIVFIVFAFGCCGTKRENSCCLGLFAALLMFIFILEAATGILAYLYETMLTDEISRNLNYTMLTSYKNDKTKTQAIDNLHQTFKCCGAGSFADWPYSVWLKNNTNTRNLVPDSCCISETFGCGVRIHPSNIYYEGCSLSLEHYLREHLVIMGAVVLGLCCLQIFGIIFSCCLIKKLKEWRERQRTNYWR